MKSEKIPTIPTAHQLPHYALLLVSNQPITDHPINANHFAQLNGRQVALKTSCLQYQLLVPQIVFS